MPASVVNALEDGTDHDIFLHFLSSLNGMLARAWSRFFAPGRTTQATMAAKASLRQLVRESMIDVAV